MIISTLSAPPLLGPAAEAVAREAIARNKATRARLAERKKLRLASTAFRRELEAGIKVAAKAEKLKRGIWVWA